MDMNKWKDKGVAMLCRTGWWRYKRIAINPDTGLERQFHEYTTGDIFMDYADNHYLSIDESHLDRNIMSDNMYVIKGKLEQFLEEYRPTDDPGENTHLDKIAVSVSRIRHMPAEDFIKLCDLIAE